MIRVEQEQQHIGELAKRDPWHRFTGLYRTICQELWLTEAWRRIAHNKGRHTAGIDGQTADDVDDALIKRLAQRLRQEEYRPTPVRRVYIPKSNRTLRPLGIPTIQDRIVQSALKMILEPIYEQDFRNCSHGFRPSRSCITALKGVALRFPRSTWLIEGDIERCFDTLHHGRLLVLLRRRIQDQKLLGLIQRFLKAGYLEQWKFYGTYSGTPQGGVLSPLLTNIYLHEPHTFMEETLHANRPRESKQEENARRTPAGRKIENRRAWLRRILDGKKRNGGKLLASPLTEEERGEIIQKCQALEERRKHTPALGTRQTIGYVRYADDYLIILQQHSKAEALRIKEHVQAYLRTHLHLEQSVEKTLITHPAEPAKFLGYTLTSTGGRRKGLRLDIPRAATNELLQEVMRLCQFHHMDEADLFLKVNSVVRGWMNYYRYAASPQRTFGKVASRVFWQVCHYLARKHGTSIPAVLRRYSASVTKGGRMRKTLRKWVKGKAVDLWLIPPSTAKVLGVSMSQSGGERKPLLIHEWTAGRSVEKRIEALEEARYQCQHCGTTENLQVHHRGGLRGYRSTKSVAAAGKAKDRSVLCTKCHLQIGHRGSFQPKNRC